MKQCRFLSPFLITAASILMLITGSFQAVAAQAGFVDPNVEGDVWDMDLQPDGRILIGGPFAKVGGQPRSCVARLNPDGTLDTSFQDPQVTGVDPSNTNVYAIARQQDGKVVIGGLFVSVAGQTRNYLARLNPDGSLDTQFAPVVSNAVSAVDVQSDGKIVIGGSFATVGGQSRSSVARLNADGSLDTTFQSPNLTYPGFGPSISAIAVQPDGKVLIGGYFITVDGQSRSFGTRLNADGTLDTGFNLTVSGPPTQFIVQPDGKLLVCGYFSTVNGTPRSAIARINADGTLDASFGNVAIPSGNVRTMGLQPDGKVVVGGEFSRIAGNDRDDLARLNADGTFDPGFQDPNANFGGTF
ncbi:MAG TPA: delta-60 repeat domain-containing protein, partial [Pyrinomonadaceae bacterium]|nr:delta-60 repeat domain-containing protein [Pyrinomonadaceae bacterium]